MGALTDYRLPVNRRAYFTALYRLNLERGIMPGLVYLYMPALAHRYGWDADQRLWFAFLNGMTQNPITSMQLFNRLPEVPPPTATLTQFKRWFDDNWDNLQYDTDRRYQKKDTVGAIKAYARAVHHFGSQSDMLRAGTAYSDLWARVRGMYLSFGRLSAFSYLEYVHLNGFGADCDDLLFEDKNGSKSHRNGMFLLLGHDEFVWDKRQPNSHDGRYTDFKPMCKYLALQADEYLAEFRATHPGLPAAGRFTLESNLCTFKNHFFGRRYPGVYADMAWERIERADERGMQAFTTVFKDIRAAALPDWLRIECERRPRLSLPRRAAQFAHTGYPFRGEHFL